MRRKIVKSLRIMTGPLALVVLIIVALILVQQKQAALDEAPRYSTQPLPVHASVTTQGNLELTRQYLAVVEPSDVAELASRLMARVETVMVDEGERVQAGQVLIRLDEQELREGIDVLKAQVAQAEAELQANEATIDSLEHTLAYRQREADRLTRLLKSDASTHSETEAAVDRANEVAGQLTAARRRSSALEKQAESLRHRQAELSTRLGYTYITSPYDGVVRDRYVDEGDLAMPGRTLLVVESGGALKLGFDLPQKDLPQIHTGLPLTYSVGDETQSAIISNLHPSFKTDRMLRAESLLTEEASQAFRCGEYISITVTVERLENVTLAPAAGLVESADGRSHVFVIRDQQLVAVPVGVLGHRDDLVALAGIEPGAQVVTSTFLGWATLGSGLRVEVMR